MIIINYMGKTDGELIRKTLDLLIEKAETYKELTEIKFTIDDYIEEGYYVKAQIQKYNDKIREFYAKRN